MRKTIVLLLPLIAHCSIAVTQAEPLRLASDVWSPYTDVEGKKAVSLELVHQALADIGFPAKTTMVATDDLVKCVETGSFDGSAAFWDDEQREHYLYYSEPYLQNRLVLVSRRENPISVALDTLQGKKVGITAGYSYGLDTSNDETGPQFVPLQGVKDIVEKLNNREIDYGILDELVYHHYSSKTAPQETDELQAAEEPILRRKLYFVLRKELPDAQKIIALFNHRIDVMKKNGMYNRILNIDWIEVDINDDGVYELLFGGDSIETLTPSNSFKIFK